MSNIAITSHKEGQLLVMTTFYDNPKSVNPLLPYNWEVVCKVIQDKPLSPNFHYEVYVYYKPQANENAEYVDMFGHKLKQEQLDALVANKYKISERIYREKFAFTTSDLDARYTFNSRLRLYHLSWTMFVNELLAPNRHNHLGLLRYEIVSNITHDLGIVVNKRFSGYAYAQHKTKSGKALTHVFTYDDEQLDEYRDKLTAKMLSCPCVIFYKSVEKPYPQIYFVTEEGVNKGINLVAKKCDNLAFEYELLLTGLSNAPEPISDTDVIGICNSKSIDDFTNTDIASVNAVTIKKRTNVPLYYTIDNKG